MPAGPSELGFVYFVAVKYAGYSLFSKYAIRRKGVPADGVVVPSPWFAGAVRTAIGVGIGVVVGLAFWRIPGLNSDRLFDNGLFFMLLVPVRIGEWWLLLRTVYRKFQFTFSVSKWLIGSGIATSFALDAAGILMAFILPGGMWVC